MIFIASVIDVKEKATKLAVEKSVNNLISSQKFDNKEILMNALNSMKSDIDYFHFIISLNALKISIFSVDNEVISPIKNEIGAFIDVISGNLEQKIFKSVDESIEMSQDDLIYPPFIADKLSKFLQNGVSIEQSKALLECCSKAGYQTIKELVNLELQNYKNMEFYNTATKNLQALEISNFKPHPKTEYSNTTNFLDSIKEIIKKF